MPGWRSEREAQEQHRALESTMASVAEGIMLLDADGTIRSWNEAAAKLFGYSAKEVVGRTQGRLIRWHHSNVLNECGLMPTPREVLTPDALAMLQSIAGAGSFVAAARANLPGAPYIDTGRLDSTANVERRSQQSSRPASR